MFAFFYPDGKLPVIIAFVKVISKGIVMLVPHIFNMRIVVSSWPQPLSECKFWITLPTSLVEKVTVDKTLSVAN